MTQLKKILFCAALGSGIGGIETWVSQLARFLPSRGWEPVIALARGYQTHQPQKFCELHPGLETIEIDGRGFDRESRTQEVMRTIRQVAPSIVIPLGMVEATEAVCRLKQKSMPVKMIIHVQGNLPPLLADLKRYRIGTDALGCPGRLTASIATSWAGYTEERVNSIPNGSNLPMVDHLAKKTDEPIRLGYVGRLTQSDKQCLDIISFVKKLNERNVRFSFDLVGSGPSEEEIRCKLQDEIRSGQVRMHGRMNAEEIFKTIYPHLDALLLFSSTESFGIVLVEAMMHGVVPVTSEYIGFHSQQLVTSGKNGLSFPIGDIEKATEAVQQLVNDDEFRTRLATTAQVEAKEKYQWETILNQWADLFDRVHEQKSLTCENWTPRTPQKNGRLNQLPIPNFIVHQIRRLRRSLFGSAVHSGEEWIFQGNDYSSELLEEIETVM